MQALLAAVLFGASAPLSKLLLGEVQPIPLAAFLYLGSGAGAFLLILFQRLRNAGRVEEAQISRSDLPWLAGALLAGGVAAPILLLFSLNRTPRFHRLAPAQFRECRHHPDRGVVFQGINRPPNYVGNWVGNTGEHPAHMDW